MRNFLLGVLLLPALAQAEPVTVEKPVVCDKLVTVIEGLQKGQYKELPVWIGKDDRSNFSLFLNEKTKTWTMVQFNDSIACILGEGEKGTFVSLKPKV